MVYQKAEVRLPPRQVEDYERLILERINFAQANYGDGEWGCLLGHKGVNCQGEVYNPELARWLRRTLLYSVGQWAGSNPGPKLEREATAWIRKHNPPVTWVWKEILPNANCQGRLGGFLAALRTRSVILVGPDHLAKLEPSVFPLKRFIQIPHEVAWKEADQTISRVKEYLEDDDVVLFASGMASNICIWKMWQEARICNRVTLLDVGALLDPYVGVYSRNGYRNKEFQEVYLPRNLQTP